MTSGRDGTVFLDTRLDRFVKLNRVGSEIWQALLEGKTETEIAGEISRTYGITLQRAAVDVRAFSKKLNEYGVENIAVQGLPELPRRSVPSLFPWYGCPQTEPSRTRIRTLVCALTGLFAFDLLLLISFRALCSVVNGWPVRSPRKNDLADAGPVCHAVSKACVWYPGKALCLQRSAVTTCLLRFIGFPARLVIGARCTPFLSHAWVEVEDRVVNDWPTVRDFYDVVACY
ncbi:MAG: hypothetical protein JWQ87_5255 [Candidatus Sulfotelmatobacter sp.]|nr:hypothetical protein [Candidatus Sulfotelmatobacter sp.]